MSNSARLSLALGVVLLAAGSAAGQTPAREDYDVAYIGAPMADPVMQHAKETYVLFGCAYCHGLYLAARGEATDLMHSALVGRDTGADRIGPLLRAGIPQTAKLSPMPQFADLSDRQIADIARWIHYARQEGRYRELSEAKPASGDASAGKVYFEKTCASCHSAAGKIAGAAMKQVLRPAFLDVTPSWTLDRLHDSRNAARERHLALLENYSAAEVANVVAYLGSLK